MNIVIYISCGGWELESGHLTRYVEIVWIKGFASSAVLLIKKETIEKCFWS